MNRTALSAAGLSLALVLLSLSCAMAAPGSWSSYKPATFTGILLTPVFSNGTTVYTLSLNPGATVTIPDGGKSPAGTYSVNWIQAFVALGATQSDSFSANGVDQGGWTWASQADTLFGWGGTGSNRIQSGKSRTFVYGSFSKPAASNVLVGIHVGYGTDGNGGSLNTDFFRTDLVTVPELPGSLVLGLGAMLSAAVMASRRRLGI